MTLQRINSVKISNWRSWEGDTVLDEISSGLIVFNGPNAIGKSGVWEAIVAGLLDKQRGKHTERFRPVGSSGLVPMVEIEFTADSKNYRVRKRFSKQLASSEATLYEKLNENWQIIEDNADNAFIVCRQIVAGSDAADLSRGGFENAVRDNLMQVLLPIQGSLVELAKAPKTLASLGVDSTMAASATQTGRILTEVSKDMTMWHKDRTKLKKSELKTHLDQVGSIKEELADLEGDSTRIDDLVNRIRSVSDDLELAGDTTSRLQEAGTLQSGADEHRERREKALARFDEAQSLEKTCQERYDNRNSRLRTIEEKESTLQEVNKDFELLKPNLQTAREKQESLHQKRDTKREESKSLSDWLESETRESRITEKRHILERVDSRLKKVDEVQTELDKLNKKLANIKVPDEKGWKTCDSLHKRWTLAQGKLEAESWQVMGSLPQDLSLKIDGEEVTNQEITGFAAKKIEIVSSDGKYHFAAVTSNPGTHSCQKAQEAVEEFLHQFDVTTIKELRSNFRQAEDLEKEIGKAESQISTALDDNTRDELIRESARLTYELKLLKSGKIPSSEKPDGEPEEWKIRIKILDEERENNQIGIDEVNKNVSSLTTKYQSKEAKKSGLEDELKEFLQIIQTEREDLGGDEMLEEVLEKAKKGTSEAKTTWKPLDEIKEIAETQKYKRAKRLREELEDAFKKQSEISELEGKLGELRRDDPEGKLVMLRTEESKLKEIVSSEQVYADALLLLEGILAENVKKHTGAVGGPVREQIQRWLRYILQDNSTELVVSDEGLPCSIRNPAAQEIEFCEQSFGTREQISLLYRLAIANLMAEKSKFGVCLMFDDPFGHTDKGRRRRMLEIIENEVEKHNHQILLFTCRPEDFSGCGSHRKLVGC